jgi:hypothetical protein
MPVIIARWSESVKLKNIMTFYVTPVDTILYAPTGSFVRQTPHPEGSEVLELPPLRSRFAAGKGTLRSIRKSRSRD